MNPKLAFVLLSEHSHACAISVRVTVTVTVRVPSAYLHHENGACARDGKAKRPKKYDDYLENGGVGVGSGLHDREDLEAQLQVWVGVTAGAVRLRLTARWRVLV